MDYNSRFLDSREKTLDSKIKDIYAKARRELESSLATFVAKKERKSKEMKALVDDGRIGEDEYKEWLKRQVFQEQQWKQKVDHCTRMMSESNEKALAIIRGEQYNVYTEGANHQAYEVEKRAQFQPDISFEIYDMQTVEKMITEEPELLPPKRLNKTKDRAWNQDIIANCVTQGIIQGESIDKIAARIAKETQRQNDASMVRYARTALTAAQNAGRIDTMKRTAEKGVKVKKRWLATLDRRTRHSHQMLDGQEQDIDRPFMSIFGKIMYPGDPEAEPGDVWNCRCTLEYVYPDFEDLVDEKVERRDNESGEVNQNMTYSQWKERKAVQKEKTKGKPKKEPTAEEKIEHLKKRISEHSGEWELDDIISCGSEMSEAIEQAIEKAKTDIEEELERVLRELKKYDDGGSFSEEWMELCDKKFELIQKRSHIVAQARLETLKKVREFGGVTQDNITSYADFKTYPYKAKQTKENVMKAMNYYPKSWLKLSKELVTELKPHYSSGRAYYSPSDGEIRISDRLPSNIHELGHRMERCVPGLLKAESEFYARRTAGCQLEWLGSGYGRNEKARKDKFTDPYMGKDYGGSAYELFSMGSEAVLAPSPRHKLDDEMRNWVLGILTVL